MENHNINDTHFELKYAFYKNAIYICGIHVNQSIIDNINSKSITGIEFTHNDFLLTVIKQIITYVPKDTVIVLYKFNHFDKICNFLSDKIGYLTCNTSDPNYQNILLGRYVNLLLLERKLEAEKLLH